MPTTQASQTNGSSDNQEEIFDDIVANTNPLMAALENRGTRDDTGLFVNQTSSFFNAKQNLLRISQLQNHRFRDYESDFQYSEVDQDKEMDLDIDKEDFESQEDNLSHFIDDEDRKIMLDFLHLKPIGDEEVGGVYCDTKQIRNNLR